jgi:regulatory protein
LRFDLAMVTVIRGLRRRTGSRRVEVELSDGRSLTLAPLIAAELHRGQTLGAEDLERLRSRDEEESVLQGCLALIARRARSRTEIRQYLRRRKVDAAVAERVLNRLGERGLVDDADFARSWVENRLALHPRSARALGQELRLKGISPELAARALAGVDEEEAAMRLARSKAARWRDCGKREFERRLGSYLARRGFSFEIIHSVLDGLYGELRSKDSGSEGGTA